MINRRNDVTQGWQFCSPITLEKEGEKRKNKYYDMGYSYLVTHPGTNSVEKGFTLLSERNMLLSLWYSDFTLNAFFLISKMRKGIEKNI